MSFQHRSPQRRMYAPRHQQTQKLMDIFEMFENNDSSEDIFLNMNQGIHYRVVQKRFTNIQHYSPRRNIYRTKNKENYCQKNQVDELLSGEGPSYMDEAYRNISKPIEVKDKRNKLIQMNLKMKNEEKTNRVSRSPLRRARTDRGKK